MRNNAIGIILVLLFSVHANAQDDGSTISGQRIGSGVITHSTPFLNISPDARGGGMGETGVATQPDANSVYWNNAKLAFIENHYGGSLSYTPWLGKITNDMFLSSLSGYYKIDEYQAIGASMRYFNLGEFEINDRFGNFISNLSPYEIAADLTYSRKLSEVLGVGITGRYIFSNTARQFAAIQETGTGSTVSFDLGVYYTKNTTLFKRSVDLSFGLQISNFGPKMEYSDLGGESPLPTNLRLGTAILYNINTNHSVTLAFDVNKLMVPSPPLVVQDPVTGELVILSGRDPDRSLLSSTFGSFTDAPGGFEEELKELMFSPGVEYWYKETIALRTGYFHENREKGSRQYLTFGLGLRYQTFGLDISYLAPVQNNHPLSETLRLTAQVDFN